MKKNRIRISHYITVITLIFLFQASVHAEDLRPIYIGDRIEMDIDAANTSELMIKEAFSDFEIISLDKMDDHYHLIFTAFEPGEYEVNLNGNPITVNIGSTLETIQRDSIYDRELTFGSGKGKQVVLILLIGSTILLLILYLPLLLKKFKRKEKTKKPLEAFNEAMDGIDYNAKESLGQMTLLLKTYLQSAMGENFVGMTTGQLSVFFKGKSDQDDRTQWPQADELVDWLQRCDALKYKKSENLPQLHKQMKDELGLAVNQWAGELEVRK